LADYFRVSNLEALSELAKAWLAGDATRVGDELLAARGLAEPRSRSLVVAGVSDSTWGEHVINRAAALADEDDADLLVVHVNVADGFARRAGDALERYRGQTADVGGTFTEVHGVAPADALADTARARGAHRVVVARHRSRLGELARGSVASRLRRLLPDVTIDVVGADGRRGR
jgi:K+-sensing histidine kinase KdpD